MADTGGLARFNAALAKTGHKGLTENDFKITLSADVREDEAVITFDVLTDRQFTRRITETDSAPKVFEVYGEGNIIGRRVDELSPHWQKKILEGVEVLRKDSELMRSCGDVLEKDVFYEENLGKLIDTARAFLSNDEPEFDKTMDKKDITKLTEQVMGWEGPDAQVYILQEIDNLYEENANRYRIPVITIEDLDDYRDGYCLVKSDRQISKLIEFGVDKIVTNKRSVLRYTSGGSVYRPHIMAANTGWYWCNLSAKLQGDIGLSRKGLTILKELGITMDVGLLLKQHGMSVQSHDHPHSYCFRNSSEEVVNNKERMTHEYLQGAYALFADRIALERSKEDVEKTLDYLQLILQGTHERLTLKYLVKNLWPFISANTMRDTRSFIYLSVINNLNRRMYYDGSRRAFFRSKEAADKYVEARTPTPPPCDDTEKPKTSSPKKKAPAQKKEEAERPRAEAKKKPFKGSHKAVRYDESPEWNEEPQHVGRPPRRGGDRRGRRQQAAKR